MSNNKFSSKIELSTKDIDYKNNNFYIKKNNKKGLFLIYADWCGYCQMLVPEWKKFVKEYSDKYTIKSFNVEGGSGNKIIAQKMGVEGYPTILYISKDGKIGGQYSGERNIKEFDNYLSKK